MTLEDAALGRRVRIGDVALDREAKDWLDAVGIHDGVELVVVRRAIFGGPLHVRTTSGGEFAIARELAAKITVTE
jgi:ferrous iron transport protein A